MKNENLSEEPENHTFCIDFEKNSSKTAHLRRIASVIRLDTASSSTSSTNRLPPLNMQSGCAAGALNKGVASASRALSSINSSATSSALHGDVDDARKRTRCEVNRGGRGAGEAGVTLVVIVVVVVVVVGGGGAVEKAEGDASLKRPNRRCRLMLDLLGRLADTGR